MYRVAQVIGADACPDRSALRGSMLFTLRFHLSIFNTNKATLEKSFIFNFL